MGVADGDFQGRVSRCIAGAARGRFEGKNQEIDSCLGDGMESSSLIISSAIYHVSIRLEKVCDRRLW